MSEIERLRAVAQAEANSGQIHYEARLRLEADLERLRDALDRAHSEVLVGDRETAMRIIEHALKWDKNRADQRKMP